MQLLDSAHYTVPMHRALFTDLYELSMAQAYDNEGMEGTAVFELFFRQMPEDRRFVVAAGLGDVLEFLENLRVSEVDLDYLRQQGDFSQPFLERLRDLRFTGEVAAIPEGSIVFPNEPLVQVRAPIVEAQLVETFVLNQVHFQSVAAAKAVRVVSAAAGRQVVDFGSRRAHGIDAALKVARASYLAGAAGTSNVLAARLYGIPVFGTMAHSYIQAHEDESDAFDAFAGLYPETTLLVDTYDTLAGVERIVELDRKGGERFRVRAVRLDSGDLGELAKQARRILDDGGLEHVKIFASGGLDEHAIAELLKQQAPIDGFGVGTKLAVSSDAPDLDMAYKLVEYDNQPRMKLSDQKTFCPGRKQVFRRYEDNRMVEDVIGRYDEPLDGYPLLQTVMRDGRRLAETERSLDKARRHLAEELDRLPEYCRGIGPGKREYPVKVSSALNEDSDMLQKTLVRSVSSP
jgi:nicotinate phosphoribosyltransferase